MAVWRARDAIRAEPSRVEARNVANWSEPCVYLCCALVLSASRSQYQSVCVCQSNGLEVFINLQMLGRATLKGLATDRNTLKGESI